MKKHNPIILSILFLYGCGHSIERRQEIQIIDKAIAVVLDSVLIEKYGGYMVVADSISSPMLDNIEELSVDINNMQNLSKLFNLESWLQWNDKGKPTDDWNGLLNFSRITYANDSGKYDFALIKKGDSGVTGTIWIKKFNGSYVLDRFKVNSQL